MYIFSYTYHSRFLTTKTRSSQKWYICISILASSWNLHEPAFQNHMYQGVSKAEVPGENMSFAGGGEAWLKLQRNNPTEHRRGLDSNHRWCSTSHRLETSHTPSQLQSSPLRLTTCGKTRKRTGWAIFCPRNPHFCSSSPTEVGSASTQ